MLMLLGSPPDKSFLDKINAMSLERVDVSSGKFPVNLLPERFSQVIAVSLFRHSDTFPNILFCAKSKIFRLFIPHKFQGIVP